ncbi:MAG: branched-chain amino acid transporter permease [Christensenellales bacterium]|jgi:branched-subunit amino acid transport protein AzlD
MTHDVLLIVVIAAVTIALRFLPFLLFGSGRRSPPIVERLERVLPYAAMGMLVVYCLKDVSLPASWPEILSCAIVVGVQVWKRNTSLSILCGTLCCVVLHRVF